MSINQLTIDWPNVRPPYASLEAAVQGETARWNAIGVVAGSVRDGQRSISSAGFANLPAGYPMRDNSLFVIGSISKVYTATLVMRLVERGLLDLDTPVVRYLPDFRMSSNDVRDAITLRMLLNHTAGFEGERFTAYGRGDDAYQRAVAEFDSLAQYFKPGACYSYNNAGYILIGHIIQAVTGDSFEKAMVEAVFAPLGLEHSIIDADHALNFPLAAGHAVDRITGVRQFMPRHPPRHMVPAAGIMQSIGDLLTFGEMHLNFGTLNGRTIISRESATLMQQSLTPSDSDYRHHGIGWSTYDYPGARLVCHAGAFSAHRANLLLVPGEGLVHASFGNSNVSHFSLWSLEDWFLEHELSFTKPRRPALTLEAEDLDRWTGNYRRQFSRFAVTRIAGGLRVVSQDVDDVTGVDRGPMREFELEPLQPGRFRITSLDCRDQTVDFFALADAEGTPRDVMRIWSRVAPRVSA